MTLSDPHTAVHLRGDSANVIADGSAAATAEARKRAHDARPGPVFLSEHSFRSIILAVESFGRLGESGDEVVNQLAVNAVGGVNGGHIARKGVVK